MTVPRESQTWETLISPHHASFWASSRRLLSSNIVGRIVTRGKYYFFHHASSPASSRLFFFDHVSSLACHSASLHQILLGGLSPVGNTIFVHRTSSPASPRRLRPSNTVRRIVPRGKYYFSHQAPSPGSSGGSLSTGRYHRFGVLFYLNYATLFSR